MLPSQLEPVVSALGPLFRHQVHVSVGNEDSTLGAYAEFSGVLGPWEADGSRVWFNVEHVGSFERNGFAIDADAFQTWGEMDGRVRIVADRLSILVRAA